MPQAVDPYAPWTTVLLVAGYALLVLGMLVPVWAAVRWIRRGSPGAGVLLAAGAVVVAGFTAIAPRAEVAVDLWAARLAVPYPVEMQLKSGSWLLGWGVVLALVGIGEALVGLGALLLRLDLDQSEVAGETTPLGAPSAGRTEVPGGD